MLSQLTELTARDYYNKTGRALLNDIETSQCFHCKQPYDPDQTYLAVMADYKLIIFHSHVESSADCK